MKRFLTAYNLQPATDVIGCIWSRSSRFIFRSVRIYREISQRSPQVTTKKSRQRDIIEIHRYIASRDMRPDSRSVSFTFHREVLAVQNSPEMGRTTRNFRQRLQDRFEKERNSSNDGAKEKSPKTKDAERAWNNISLGNVSADSRRALRNGAEKLSRTISSVRTTFGTISQKFRSSTRRRQRLEEQQSPCNMQTPQTRSRQLLGRTPTKLYSPFGIESPRHAWDKENNPSTPMRASSPECSSRYINCRPFRFAKAKGFSMLR